MACVSLMIICPNSARGSKETMAVPFLVLNSTVYSGRLLVTTVSRTAEKVRSGTWDGYFSRPFTNLLALCFIRFIIFDDSCLFIIPSSVICPSVFLTTGVGIIRSCRISLTRAYKKPSHPYENLFM